jgi:CTP:molybdopterin cytidylyltransferase MocA
MMTALLLAAGQGRRMQYKAKALLALGKETFVQHALQELHKAGLDDLLLVTGAQRQAVWDAACLAKVPLREAYNPDYPSGLISSIQAGLKACPASTEAVLITLVDLPFLTADDYRSVSLAFRKGEADGLLRAQSQGKPAHPVVIPRAYFAEILQEPPADSGCSFLFQRYPERVRCHEVTRGRIDIDTIEDYHAHITS